MSIYEDLTGWLGVGGVQIRRRIRILMLLDAADYAVISPIPIPRFHALAFLADVLSPIYTIRPTNAPNIETQGLAPTSPISSGRSTGSSD